MLHCIDTGDFMDSMSYDLIMQTDNQKCDTHTHRRTNRTTQLLYSTRTSPDLYQVYRDDDRCVKKILRVLEYDPDPR